MSLEGTSFFGLAFGLLTFLSSFTSGSDFFSSLSLLEGFGSSVIEASSCSKPVILSNIYGLRDSAINNFTGLFFERGNIYDLQKKLEYLLDNKSVRNMMGSQGRNYVLQNFNQKIVIKNYINYINKIL